MNIGRYRICIIVGTVVVSILLFFISYYKPFRYLSALYRINKIRNVWDMQSYVSFTNYSGVRLSIDDIVDRVSDIDFIDTRNINKLKEQIYNMVLVYSSGDFERFVDFRMPCGYKVNVSFVGSELTNYIDNVIYKYTYPSVSSGSDKVIWERMWDVSVGTVVVEGGTKVWCSDCWKGFSPVQSWVKIRELPITFEEIESSDVHLGFSSIKSDLQLSPPDIHGNDSTPKAYACVKLHIDIGKHYLHPDNLSQHHPIYAIFVLTTNPECWIPVAFATSASYYYKYIF